MKVIRLLQILLVIFASTFFFTILMAILSVKVPAILFIIAATGSLIVTVIAYMLRDNPKEINKIGVTAGLMAAAVMLTIAQPAMASCSLIGPIPIFSCVTLPVEIGFLVLSWWSCTILWTYVPSPAGCMSGTFAISTILKD